MENAHFSRYSYISVTALPCKIGVISHVEAFKERIQAQIEIKKISELGFSKLDK